MQIRSHRPHASYKSSLKRNGLAFGLLVELP